MTSTCGRSLVLGMDPLQYFDALDLWMGACLWDLCLDKYTGDGRFDGETFLGRLLIFFLGGAGEGNRSSRVRVVEKFSQDGGLQTALFVIYIIC